MSGQQWIRVSAVDGAKEGTALHQVFSHLLQTLPSKEPPFPLLGHGTKSSEAAP